MVTTEPPSVAPEIPADTTEIPADTTETILKIISKNPMVTAKEIATVCGITEDGVAYHITSGRTNLVYHASIKEDIL